MNNLRIKWTSLLIKVAYWCGYWAGYYHSKKQLRSSRWW